MAMPQWAGVVVIHPTQLKIIIIRMSECLNKQGENMEWVGEEEEWSHNNFI